jgi:hypothetical protein
MCGLGYGFVRIRAVFLSRGFLPKTNPCKSERPASDSYRKSAFLSLLSGTQIKRFRRFLAKNCGIADLRGSIPSWIFNIVLICQYANSPNHRGTKPRGLWQSTNPPIHQSTNPPIHQFTNLPINPRVRSLAGVFFYTQIRANPNDPLYPCSSLFCWEHR